MDLLASQITQLQEQVRCLPELVSTVSSLPSNNEAQASLVARLSSENASLKSEVALLKREKKDQDKVIGELIRSSSTGGFWVWESRREEGKEDEGRWLWSLEKYEVLPPAVVASGPPTSLLSLPVELLDATFVLLSEDDQGSLCRVSFRIFEVASKYIFGGRVWLDYEAACSFLRKRFDDPKSRIAPFLHPKKVSLVGDSPSPDKSTHELLVSTLGFSSNPPPLPVHNLQLVFKGDFELDKWDNILRLFDPHQFQVRTAVAWHDQHQQAAPTVHFLPLQSVTSFSSAWRRVSKVSFCGPSSVILVEGTWSTSAFEDCLRRGSSSPASSTLRVRLRKLTSRGTDTLKEMKSGRSITSFLAESRVAGGGSKARLFLELAMKSVE